ncbi:hypothetical protein NOR_06121 [Metarhizium rileyi]|uniref:Uncharacterized protein n=1 Tax=Metarhizium rileyi (strain RCEF 4871) TaxID=1649241 RepID=A0A167B6E4_METRR|nr:hypothetical protein NOR_06121 [Metarhizium rileyi RCEF 4871]
MKSSIAALTLLAALGSTQDVRRDVTHLFSNPPQPTPNESTPTGLFSILPVSSDTASASHSGVTTTPSETAAPTTIGHISSNVTTGTGSTATPTITSSGQLSSSGSSTSVSSTRGSSATTSSSQGSGTLSSTRSSSTSRKPSTTSNPAAAPTAFENNFVAAVIALAGLAVAI